MARRWELFKCPRRRECSRAGGIPSDRRWRPLGVRRGAARGRHVARCHSRGNGMRWISYRYDDGAWSRLPAPISQRGWRRQQSALEHEFRHATTGTMCLHYRASILHRYEKATALAVEAHCTGRGVAELVLERRLLPPATLSAILAPEVLTKPHHRKR